MKLAMAALMLIATATTALAGTPRSADIAAQAYKRYPRYKAPAGVAITYRKDGVLVTRDGGKVEHLFRLPSVPYQKRLNRAADVSVTDLGGGRIQGRLRVDGKSVAFSGKPVDQGRYLYLRLGHDDVSYLYEPATGTLFANPELSRRAEYSGRAQIEPGLSGAEVVRRHPQWSKSFVFDHDDAHLLHLFFFSARP